MSKRLKSFNFRGRRGAKRQYPWDLWFDGGIHELIAGVDFTNAVAVMRATIYMASKRMGVSVRTSETDKGNLVIQAMRGESVDDPT